MIPASLSFVSLVGIMSLSNFMVIFFKKEKRKEEEKEDKVTFLLLSPFLYKLIRNLLYCMWQMGKMARFY